MRNHDLSQLGVLLLRIALGVMFFAHGFIFAFVTFSMAAVAQFFVSVGLPEWLAYVVVFMETVGGILLVLGVQTRWVALALSPVVIGSLVFVHIANGWVFSAPNGGWEYPAYLLVLCIAQALLGDGPYALSPSASLPLFRTAQPSIK